MHHQNNFPIGGFIVSRQELSPAGVPLQDKMSSNLLIMIVLVKTGQLERLAASKRRKGIHGPVGSPFSSNIFSQTDQIRN